MEVRKLVDIKYFITFVIINYIKYSNSKHTVVKELVVTIVTLSDAFKARISDSNPGLPTTQS